MRQGARISVVIPALNEEDAIGQVLEAIPPWVDDIVVADNGSSDQTTAIAAAHGACVVSEAQQGYGSACLAGLAAVDNPTIVVFLDADFSDHPDEMGKLVDPIIEDHTDLVIGSRVRGAREPGALTPQARFGNWLSCLLIRLFWGMTFSDLGPFRAIRASTLGRLHMQDRDFGWTVEMQVKAAAASVRTSEVPVSYRNRIGTSKISGTVRGVILAGTKILYTIFRAALRPGWLTAHTPRDALLFFARFPVSGQAKTRLIPALGPRRAAELHRRMTEHAVGVGRSVRTTGDAAVTVCHTGAPRRDFQAWLGHDLHYSEQPSAELGERLQVAFDTAFGSGVSRALAVGTDVPDVSPDLLHQALEALTDHDVVLGPAADGGYYLIGMKQLHRELFAGIDWGTEHVADQTRSAIHDLGLTARELPRLNDIDRPEDLDLIRTASPFKDVFSGEPLLSVIIPTLNEAQVLRETLRHVNRAGHVEVIVADGGSTDTTCEIAEQAGATVVKTAGGRAAQLNAGTAMARGRYLLVLHADTLPPEHFVQMISHALADPATVAGAFRFHTDETGWRMHMVEWATNLRCRILRWPYGDQGLFLEKRVFGELGGFAELPIMEDFEFGRRLRRRGRLVILSDSAVTSARRWRRLGIVRTGLRNQAVLIGFLLGVTPEILARFYRGAIERD